MGIRYRKFKKISRSIWSHLKASDLRWVAGSLAFSTVLALVPFLALTLTVFQLFGGLDFLVPKVQSLLLQYFQEAMGIEASNILKRIISQLKPKTLGLTSALFLLFASLRLLQDIEIGISRMWQIKLPRPLFRRILVPWLLFTAFTLLLAAYIGFRSLDFVQPVLKTGKGAFDFIVLCLGLFLLYKYLPPVRVRALSALRAAAVAGVGVLALQSSFSILMKSFFFFSKIYGSLATIPLLLIWVLLLWYVILAGAALTAILDKSHLNATHK